MVKVPANFYEGFIEKTKPLEEYIKMRIKYEHMKVSINLGAYMFKDYKNLKSLNPKAKLLLDAAIKLSYDYLARSSVTNESMLRRYLRLLEFVYNNDLPLPIEPNDARHVIQQYRIYCLKAKTSPETNAINFNLALACLKYLFEDPEIYATIVKGIKTIKRNKKLNATSANVNEVEYAISYYYNFFMKVTDFVLENNSFPYKLTLNGVETLLIPNINQKYAITKDITFKTQSILMFLDFENGNLRTEKSMIQKFHLTHPKWNSKSDRAKVYFVSKSKNKLRKYKEKIHDANIDPFHLARLELAQRAFKAFFMLLGAFTGMKDSELAAFEWPDDNKIESSKSNILNLAVIKPRANYKEIHLNINRIGVPLFKKALKLRKYLLQDYSCPKFFFKGYFDNATYDNTLAQGTYGGQCISQHKVLHPDLPIIGTKKLRVYKNKMVLSITNGDMWLASASIGNSITTNSDYYQGEIEEKKDTQLSNFVENMVRQCTEEGNSMITPQGKCEEYNNPEHLNGNSTLNCNNPFDCFRCKHYFVTTDKETIHKLISLQYIIKRLQRQRAFNDDHFDDVMAPIENKIEHILIIMAQKHNLGVLLNEITSLVFKKEILHSYWAFRLHHLFAINQI